MDCYMGRELLVPSYQESSSSETYQSNGMWGGWSMNSPEATDKCFGYDTFNGDEDYKMSKPFYGSSLEDLQGIEHMDDIFLSSILEDVPGNDEDVNRASSNSNCVGSSSMFDSHAMPLKEEAPFTISDFTEENMLDSYYADEPSAEELVLQELQRASQKMTHETRKCFRDTFYRLARNSREQLDPASSANNYDYCDITKLSIENQMESETNSIDRAVANLTFNKMESNISNFPLLERVH